MTNEKLHFRIATPDDAVYIQHLVESAFRAEDSRPGWMADISLSLSFHLELEDVVTRITNLDSETLLATNDNANLVASVVISKRGTNGARISMLAVDPEYHRGGIGRQVLAHAEEYCQHVWGVTKLELDALSTRRELISWYLRHGYRMTGESTPFPHQKIDNLNLDNKDWRFLEMEKDLRIVKAAENVA